MVDIGYADIQTKGKLEKEEKRIEISLLYRERKEEVSMTKLFPTYSGKG